MKFIKIKAPVASASFPRHHVAFGYDKAEQEILRVHGENMVEAKERLLFIAKALKDAGTEVEFIPNFSWTLKDFRTVHPEHNPEVRG